MIERVGFVTASLGWRDPDDGATWINAGLGRLIEAIGARVGRLSISTSFSTTRSTMQDHRLPTRHGIRFLPSMPSMSVGLRRGAACARTIAAVERESDVTIVQLPFSAPTGLLGGRKPRVYHVCADLPAVVGASRFYRGSRRIVALTAATVIDALQGALINEKSASAVTNGEVLHRRYRKGSFVVSSALRTKELEGVQRERPLTAPFRILFVGYLRPEKGVDVLVDAFERILERLPSAELEIVGGSDLSETGAARALDERISVLERSGRAHKTGPLAFGPALFQRYADADVLVLPTRSEGTPRVLVEARAFGCPVVASRVGGIPSSVSDGVDGLLVPPDDAAELARAVLRIHEDSDLRARLIASGRTRTRRMTVDVQADALLAEADELLKRVAA